ncbi:hypothetical protein SEVIR_2G356901v4 [Setaria viridis]
MELQEYYAPRDKSLIDDYLRPKIAGKKRKADAAMSFSQILEDELLLQSYFESLFAGVEPAAPEYQDQPNDDDDDVIEISLDEFLGSSASRAVPPRAAHPECATSCVQTPSRKDRSTDGEEIEFSAEKLTVASSPERGSTPSALPDDDDDDMCGLACPLMDDVYVELILSEPLVQFDPAFIEEFISDL